MSGHTAQYARVLDLATLASSFGTRAGSPRWCATPMSAASSPATSTTRRPRCSRACPSRSPPPPA